MTLTTDIGKPLTAVLSESRQSAPLVQVECNGFDPVEFVSCSGWTAKSVSFFFFFLACFPTSMRADCNALPMNVV